jgi:hypothetical protein
VTAQVGSWKTTPEIETADSSPAVIFRKNCLTRFILLTGILIESRIRSLYNHYNAYLFGSKKFVSLIAEAVDYYR